jgi:putative acetyltransferase
MAVAPARQRQGAGWLWWKRRLRRHENPARRRIVVLGHTDYYPRFGLSAEIAGKLAGPFSGPAFMALKLIPALLREGGVRSHIMTRGVLSPTRRLTISCKLAANSA